MDNQIFCWYYLYLLTKKGVRVECHFSKKKKIKKYEVLKANSDSKQSNKIHSTVHKRLKKLINPGGLFCSKVLVKFS